MEVFLGGTCADGTNWRERLIPKLKVDYFNPVVDDWNDEAYQNELKKRETCDFVLYVISPIMIGCYSVAEAIDDSNKRPKKTLFCVIDKDGDGTKTWRKEHLKSFKAISKMVEKNGGKSFDTLDDVANYLNYQKIINR